MFCGLQDTIDDMNKTLTRKVANLTDDVANLNDSLSTEKADRTTADENLNTKLLAQCEKVRRWRSRQPSATIEQQC